MGSGAWGVTASRAAFAVTPHVPRPTPHPVPIPSPRAQFHYLPVRTALLLLALVVTTAPRTHPPLSRTPAILLLRVVDSASRLPLPNAEVTAIEARALTDVNGEVRILWPDDGELRVRIRQLGFRYFEGTFHRGTSTTAREDTAVVAMVHSGWALPQVVVRAERRCREAGDPSHVALTESSMELLRLGADQFENFRRSYPFDITLEARTMLGAAPGRLASQRKVQVDTMPSAEWGDRYTPGSVVQPRGRNEYFVPLLFVSALADSAFWSRHCFQARGVESREGRRLIRLDFHPMLDVREPEWEGSAWLDSARSVLARVDFRLTNLRGGEGPQQFEGYTIFSTPTPYIAMPDSTVASWITQWSPAGPYGEMRRSRGMQTLVIRDVAYRRRKPPGVER